MRIATASRRFFLGWGRRRRLARYCNCSSRYRPETFDCAYDVQLRKAWTNVDPDGEHEADITRSEWKRKVSLATGVLWLALSDRRETIAARHCHKEDWPVRAGSFPGGEPS